MPSAISQKFFYGASGGETADENNGDVVPIVRNAQTFGDKHPSPTERIIRYHDVVLCQPGDILLTISAGERKIRFNICDMPIAIGASVMAIRCQSHMDCEYLYYWLLHSAGRIEALTVGSGAISRISVKTISSLLVTGFEWDKQKRIVEILGTVDALRMRRKQSILELEGAATALFVKNFGHPLSNPGKWGNVDIRELGNFSLGVFLIDDAMPEELGGDQPLVRASDISDWFFVDSTATFYSDANVKRAKVWPERTLCISTGGKRKVGILSYAACLPPVLWGMTPDTSMVDPLYLGAALKLSYELGAEISSPLSPRHKPEGKVLLPSLETQRRFSSFLQKTDTTRRLMLDNLTVLSDLLQNSSWKLFGRQSNFPSRSGYDVAYVGEGAPDILEPQRDEVRFFSKQSERRIHTLLGAREDVSFSVIAEHLDITNVDAYAEVKDALFNLLKEERITQRLNSVSKSLVFEEIS